MIRILFNVIANAAKYLLADDQSKGPKTRRRAKPGLEVLEDRCTPATNFVVNTDLDNNVGAGTAGSLRWCINQANALANVNGVDSIEIPSGRDIKLGSALPVITEEVYIEGAGAGASKVARDATLGGNYRIFENNANIGWLISGVTIGGGDVIGNGGGILNKGNLTLINSEISGCKASLDGGGIYNETGAQMEIRYSNITDNQAMFDGGGLGNKGTATIRDSYIQDNNAGNGGGEVENEAAGTITLIDTIFWYNTAVKEGGAAYNLGTLTMGGGRMEYNTCLNNGAGNGNGGGLACEGGQATLTNVLIRANEATNKGGGVYIGDGNVDFFNCTVTGNDATTGDDLFVLQNQGTYTANAQTVFGTQPVIGP